MLDYRLQTFLTLCETMHYTKAAERLNITQPAVTQHIQFLENHYGCRLFDYRGKVLRLTKQGEYLRKMAVSLFYNSCKMEETMRLPHPICLQIGATKSIGEFVITPLIRKFLENHPEDTVTLTVDNTQTLLRELEQGKLDFALVEGFFDKNKYDFKLFRKEKFFGICAVNHPFAGKKVSMQDLLQQPLILREKGSGTRAILQDTLHEYNYTFDYFPRLIEISSFAVIKDLVAQGLGVSFVYRPVVQQELDNQKLAEFSIEGIDIQREFNLVYLCDALFFDVWADCIEILESLQN